MGTKALVRLAIVLAVVGVLALIVKLTGPGTVKTVSGGDGREKVFPEFPENIEKIRITDGEGVLNLEKQESGGWGVAERDGHPAKIEEIAAFVRDVYELKVVQTPEIGPSQFGTLQLLDPAKGASDESATIVSFRNAEGKELESIWLGKIYERADSRPSFMGGPSTTEAGRYVKPGGEEVVFLVGESFSDIDTEAAGWLDETFFNVEKIKSIEIRSEPREEEGDEWSEADNWKLTREDLTEDFTLVDAQEGEELDNTKVSGMKSAFANKRFEDVAVKDEAADNKPERTTHTVETFDGFTYTIKSTKKNDVGELYLTFDVDAKLEEKREEGEEEEPEEKERLDKEFEENLKTLKEKLADETALAGKIYKVRGFVVDNVTKKRSELLKEPEEKEEIAPGVSEIPGVTPGNLPPALRNLPGAPNQPSEDPGPDSGDQGDAPGETPAADKPTAPSSEKKPDAPDPEKAEKPATEPKADKPAEPSGETKPESAEEKPDAPEKPEAGSENPGTDPGSPEKDENS